MTGPVDAKDILPARNAGEGVDRVFVFSVIDITRIND